MSKQWTYREAKNDYEKSLSKNKGRKCTTCQFGSSIAYCDVKNNSFVINNGELRALFCKYFTKIKESQDE